MAWTSAGIYRSVSTIWDIDAHLLRRNVEGHST
jgi:hypothetical protein